MRDQRKEIETIKERTITLKLSDADVVRITERAERHGLTVSELLENFIGDLVGGTYSNGSDERDFADQWFDRCWFGMFPEVTPITYLLEEWTLDQVSDLIEEIEDIKSDIAFAEEDPEEEPEEYKDALAECENELKEFYSDYASRSEDPVSLEAFVEAVKKYEERLNNLKGAD